MTHFEEAGRPRDEVMSELVRMRDGDIDWRGGRTSAYVFSAGEEIRSLGKEAYNEYFTENALGARRAFPSVRSAMSVAKTLMSSVLPAASAASASSIDSV